jgi:hypothetical protein
MFTPNPKPKQCPYILNVTLPLKQDAASQAKIKVLAGRFATDFWPKVRQVLADSEMVHYARFVVIGDPPRYIQILTEYDTDFRVYTDYFADNLKDFFGTVFDVIEGAPPVGTTLTRDQVYELVNHFDLPCLGGVAFSAIGDRTVKEVKQKFPSS